MPSTWISERRHDRRRIFYKVLAIEAAKEYIYGLSDEQAKATAYGDLELSARRFGLGRAFGEGCELITAYPGAPDDAERLARPNQLSLAHALAWEFLDEAEAYLDFRLYGKTRS